MLSISRQPTFAIHSCKSSVRVGLWICQHFFIDISFFIDFRFYWVLFFTVFTLFQLFSPFSTVFTVFQLFQRFSPFFSFFSFFHSFTYVQTYSPNYQTDHDQSNTLQLHNPDSPCISHYPSNSWFSASKLRNYLD